MQHMPNNNSPDENPGRWSQRQWFLVVMITLMHGLNHAYYVMMAPLFVPLKEHFGFAQLSPVLLLGTAYLAPYGFSHLFFGFLSDRTNKSRLLGIGGLVSSLCFLLGALVPRYPVLLSAVVVAGISGATYHSVSPALLTILFPSAKGRGLGISGIGAAVGLALTPLLSGLIGEHYGWRASFAFFAAIGILFSLFFLFTVTESGRHVEASGQSPPIAWKRVILLLMPLVLYLVFREFCGWGAFSLVPTFAQIEHGYSVSDAGRLSTCVTLAGLVSGPLFGILSDRLNRGAMLIPLTLTAGGLIIWLPHNPQAYLAVTALAFGFFYSATVPILDALIGDVAPNKVKGLVFGAAVSVGIGLGSMSPWLAGTIVDRFSGEAAGFRLAFLILGASLVTALLPLTWFVIRATRGCSDTQSGTRAERQTD